MLKPVELAVRDFVNHRCSIIEPDPSELEHEEEEEKQDAQPETAEEAPAEEAAEAAEPPGRLRNKLYPASSFPVKTGRTLRSHSQGFSLSPETGRVTQGADRKGGGGKYRLSL